MGTSFASASRTFLVRLAYSSSEHNKCVTFLLTVVATVPPSICQSAGGERSRTREKPCRLTSI